MPDSYSSSGGSGDTGRTKGGPGRSEEEEDGGLTVNSVESGLMGMLYTVGKEKKYTLPFVIFRLVIDLVQLLLLSMNPQYGFNIDPSNGAWKVFSFLQLNDFMSARGYSFFLACLYIMAAGLAMNVGLCIWVSKSFAENRFDRVWPIVCLRWYSLIFYQVLDIASMTLFLMTMDCRYYWVDPAVQFTHQEFDGVDCFTMPHMAHVGVAATALVFFSVLATAFTMAEIDLNPVSRNALGMGHTKVEGISFILKFIMTSATVFLNSPQWLSIVLAGCSWYLLYLYLMWEPHLNKIVNQIRVASYAMVVYSSMMLIAVAFPPASVEKDDPDQLSAYQAQVTGALWGGLIPAGLLGWLGSWLRLRYFLKTVAGRFEAAELETPSTHIHKFSDPREVEITSRVLRVWIDEDHLDPGRVALAERIMRAGKSQLGSSPYMSILWSSFLIDVQDSYQSGYLALQAAKKAPHPSFLERFAIFIREQEHTQKATAATAGDSGNVDLVSYVEFQRNLSLVIRLHKEALLAKRAFWIALESHRLARFDKLSAAVARIEAGVRAAERMYRTVLARHSSSVKILQLYVKFLQGVKGDPWTAARWAAEAEKLQRIEEEANEKTVMGGNSNLDSNDESKGIIIIGANCLIRMANDAAAAALGYGNKARMIGHNVNVIVPPPFSKMHNQYVRNYITTGQAKILNQTTEFVAVHRDRYVVPVRMQISHVSGIGEDSVFMGVMQALPQKEGVATLWVLSSGAIVACDATFTDWLGYKQGDLQLNNFTDLVVEKEEVDRLMLAAREAQNAVTHAAMHAGSAGHNSLAMRFSTSVPIAEGQEPVAEGRRDITQMSQRDSDEYITAASLALDAAAEHQGGGRHLAQPSMAALAPPAPRNRTPPSNTPRALLAGDDDSAIHSQASKESPRLSAPKGFLASKGIFSDSGTTPAGTTPIGSGKVAGKAAVHPQPPSGAPANNHGSNPAARGRVAGNSDNGWDKGRKVNKQVVSEMAFNAENLHVRHNYNEKTVRVAMEVRACSMGDRYFFVVSMTRMAAEESLMLVTDNKGHVVHATQALATRLNTTVSAMFAGSTPHALDALLPPPFTRMHHLWYKDAAQTVPGADGKAGVAPPPPHSCRSGLPVCIPATSPMGLPEQQVYSLSFKLRTTAPLQLLKGPGAAAGGGGAGAMAISGPGSFVPNQAAQLARTMGEALHVVTLTPSTMEAALDARRLRLVVSMEDATVLSTSPSPNALFEFDPKSLVGSSLAFAIDVLRPRPRPGTEMSHAHLVEAEKAAGRLLRMLAERNRASPGTSWRVGVSPSIDPVEVAALGGVGEDMVAAATKAAVMTVRFKVEAPTLAGATLTLPKIVELEVELWRADLMTAVMEVDAHGNIVTTGMPGVPFYEPHLLLGVPKAKVPGAHLSTVLPVTKGMAVIAALFTEGGFSNTTMINNLMPPAPKKAGVLKGKVSKGATGPLHVVRMTHAGDGRELELRATAVVKGTPGMMSGSAYVLLRFSSPALCGRIDLASFLEIPRPPAAVSGNIVVPGGRSRHASQLMAAQNVPISREVSRLMMGSTPVPLSTAFAPALAGVPDVESTEAMLFGAQLAHQGSRHDVQFVDADEPPVQEGGSPESPPLPAGSRVLQKKMTKDDKNSAVTAWLMMSSTGGDAHAQGVQAGAEEYSMSGHPGHMGAHPGGAQMLVPQMTLDDEAMANEGPEAEEVMSAHGETDADAAAAQEMLEHELVDQEADAGAMAAYKRGKRYRRLSKMLTSKDMQMFVKRLQYATFIVVGLLLAIEVASFTSYYMQLMTQNTQIDYMFGTARAANEVLGIVQDVAALQVLYSSQGVKGLRYLQNNSADGSDVKRLKALMSTSINQVQLYHQTLYHGNSNTTDTGGSRMPTDYGLRALWEEPSLNFSVWYADKLNAAYQPIAQFTMISLWEGGNLFLAAAKNLLANGGIQNSLGPTAFSNLTDTWFILQNGAVALNQGYRQSAVGILSITLDKSKQLNQSQQIMLIIEGAFAVVCALVVIIYFSQALARRRYGVYSVFVRVPIGVIHGLAAAPLGLGEDGEQEEEEEEEQLAQQLAGKDGQRGQEEDFEQLVSSAGKSAHRNSAELAVSGKDPEAHAAPQRTTTTGHEHSAHKQKSQGCCAWLFPAKQQDLTSARGKAGLYGGRSLVKSYKDTILLVWPFVLWGAVVIALAANGVISLNDMEGAIANLNIVSGVYQSVNRCNVWAIQLAEAEANDTLQLSIISQLKTDLDYLRAVYSVELYGNAAGNASITADLTGGHTTAGIAFQGEGFQILYENMWAGGCLAFNPADCLNSSAMYYPFVANGLDAMLEEYIYQLTDLINTPVGNISLSTPAFKYIWEVGFVDLVNGCRRTSMAYVSFVHALYNSTLVLHSISMGFSFAIAFIYLLFIFRPFINKANNEPRRVAELLSCLPPELDVEGMVKGVVVMSKEDMEGKTGSRGSNSSATARSWNPPTSSVMHRHGL